MKKIILITVIFLFNYGLKSQNITHQDEKKVFVNNFNILNSLNTNLVINQIGNPSEIIDGGIEQLEEFGYQTYEYFYGQSYIIFRNNLISDVFILDDNLSINGIKIGDSMNSVKSEFEKFNMIDGYLKVFYGDFTISFSFDQSNNVKEITYYVPI